MSVKCYKASPPANRGRPRQLPSNATNGKTVGLVVVVLRVDIGTIEVQVPGVRSRVRRTGPIVAVRTTIVHRRTGSVMVAGANKQQRPGQSQRYLRMNFSRQEKNYISGLAK